MKKIKYLVLTISLMCLLFSCAFQLPEQNKDTFKIRYDLNGGTAENPTSYNVNDEIKLANPKKEGYTFLGWTTPTNNIPYLDVIISNQKENLHFTANWSSLKFDLIENDEYEIDSLRNDNEKEIIIPEYYNGKKITSIGENSFIESKKLTKVQISNNIKTIGNYAFASCNKLTTITISDNITSIGVGVFAGCDSLTNITVNENNLNYQSIDGNLYSKDGKTLIQYAVGKLNSTFIIPKTIETIEEGAFTYCKNLKNILCEENSKLTTIKTGSFAGCSNLVSVEIPSSVISIGDVAFASCTNLTSINIPNSVTSIGELVFNTCTNLTSINVDENNLYYQSIDGNLYSKDGKTLIQYAIGKQDSNFIIPNHITTIGSNAFRSCSNLKSIELSNSVTHIGEFAFASCTNLANINIPNSVTNIEGDAFNQCTNLTKIVIPINVTYIGTTAFAFCDKLTIYCEADSQPSGWAPYWNYYNEQIVWGYKVEE